MSWSDPHSTPLKGRLRVCDASAWSAEDWLDVEARKDCSFFHIDHSTEASFRAMVPNVMSIRLGASYRRLGVSHGAYDCLLYRRMPNMLRKLHCALQSYPVDRGWPTVNDTTAHGAIAAFRKLHESGCFVLPNPWDRGSAIYLHSLGYQALATTSAGFGFSRGVPDHIGAMPLDHVLAHCRDIVAATPLPVNADFQEGYAADPEGVAANVARCVATGVAGLSIEDATGNEAQPLFECDLAIERIRAARAAIDASGHPAVLTARCEAWLVGDSRPLQTALDRLTAYAEAGADCLYAPGVREPDEIGAIVKAVHPKPVNVLVVSSESGLTVSQLADLGVRRISVGSALSRAAWGAFMRAAKRIADDGSFDEFDGAAPFPELNEIFKRA